MRVVQTVQALREAMEELVAEKLVESYEEESQELTA